MPSIHNATNCEVTIMHFYGIVVTNCIQDTWLVTLTMTKNIIEYKLTSLRFHFDPFASIINNVKLKSQVWLNSFK